MRLRSSLFLVGAGALALAASACSASVDSVFQGNGGNGTGGASSGGSGGANTGGTGNTGNTGGDINIGGLGGSGGGGIPTCQSGPNDDADGDGWTPAEGDCNDCDPNANPAAVEVVVTEPDDEGNIPPPVDEDCSGAADDPPPPCDTTLAIDDMDPMSAARAVGLCKQATGPDDWGVVSAEWVLPDGNPAPANPNFHLGHGILSGFGNVIVPYEGSKLLALSSGTARQPTDPGYQSPGGFSKGYTSGHPVGFPKESPACPGVITGPPNDGTGVRLTIRAPSNANGFSFDFDFYTYEWPGYVCSTFNDFFVALMSPIPAGQMDGNISFDSLGNPVSVNNAFLSVCGCANSPGPCTAGGKTFTCPLGTAELMGTGFEDAFGGSYHHAATSWLRTTAPVTPGQEITITWATYDSQDQVLDSTTLIDNWLWIAEPGTQVETQPPPPPN